MTAATTTPRATRFSFPQALKALWDKATEYGSDYRVASVHSKAEGCLYVAMVIRVDLANPGDRITQPNRSTGMGGGNLGFALPFSQPVVVPLPSMADGASRGDLRIKGAFAIADATEADFERLGEDRSDSKWDHLNRKAAPNKRRTVDTIS